MFLTIDRKSDHYNCNSSIRQAGDEWQLLLVRCVMKAHTLRISGLIHELTFVHG